MPVRVVTASCGESSAAEREAASTVSIGPVTGKPGNARVQKSAAADNRRPSAGEGPNVEPGVRVVELKTERGRKPSQQGRPSAEGGDVGNSAAPDEGPQPTAETSTATDSSTQRLMEAVLERDNLIAALERVEVNKGCAGIDGMRTEELRPWLKAHWAQVREQLLGQTYRPKPVLRKAIPKPDGGTRNLGIPTVLDRFIQQALLQVLAQIFSPQFSVSSYAYQEGRSAHDAVRAARRFVVEGNEWVVDLDIEKFFDQVNHDILMRLVAEKVHDKRVLKLIGRFLRSGVMVEGVVMGTEEGTPQGGPLSPLLSNIMLDPLDKELERRGLRFCRYADDCNIYVRSERAAQRVMESVKRFLERKLKLKVNGKKSAVARPSERRFLGFTIQEDEQLGLAPRAREKLHDTIVALTARTCGHSMEQVIKRLNLYLEGWIGYFALVDNERVFGELDGWIRRRLRMLWWMHRKNPKTRREALIALGVPAAQAGRAASSGRGPWRMSATPSIHSALSKRYFNKAGLVSLAAKWAQKRAEWQHLAWERRTAVCGPAYR